MGMSRLAFLASPPIDVTDSNPTRIRMATVACTNTQPKLWMPTTDAAFGWVRKLPLSSLLGIADRERHRLAGGVQLRLAERRRRRARSCRSSGRSPSVFSVANS